MNRSEAELYLETQLRQLGIDGYKTQYRFHPARRWTFDFAWLDAMLAVEIDGGNHMATINPRTGQPVSIGRHTQDADLEKLNEAAIMGWCVLRFSPKMVIEGAALVIERALGLVREANDEIPF